MTKAKTIETVRERERERERELYFTNIKCGFIKHDRISNLIKIQEGRNTFIGSIKKTDYK